MLSLPLRNFINYYLIDAESKVGWEKKISPLPTSFINYIWPNWPEGMEGNTWIFQGRFTLAADIASLQVWIFFPAFYAVCSNYQVVLFITIFNL